MLKRPSLLLIAAFAFASCNKQPSADFTTDKGEYVAGETVELTNTSTDAVTYLWTMPDGQTSTSKDVNYILPENMPDTTLTFRLQSYSKKNKKNDDATQTIPVKAAYGDATFWQSTGSPFGVTTVHVNGQSVNITSEYGSDPGCGQAGNANFHLKVGTYNFTASDGITNWSGTITIQKNGCNSTHLT